MATDIMTSADQWFLDQMLNSQNVDSAKKHVHVQMTGKMSNGQELKGNTINPISGGIELTGYMVEYSRNLDKLTQKSSSPTFDGAYLMFEHTNEATVHFLQAMHSAVTADLVMHHVRNDTGTKPEEYGNDKYTKARVALLITSLNSIIGPYTFVKILAETLEITVGKVAYKYDYLKGTQDS